MAASSPAGDDAGRHAARPSEVPARGWLAVAKRAWAESSHDNVSLVAAGVAFYTFLALVPLLAATVLIYGLVADVHDVARHMQALTSTLPREAAQLIGEQLASVVKSSDGKKGIGLLMAIALALFSARGMAGALISGLNIAYEEDETRGFLRVNLVALAITAAMVLTFVIAIVGAGASGYLHVLLPNAGPVISVMSRIVGAAVMVLVAAAGSATLYRYGPARQEARWRWLTPGSSLFAGAWLLLTIGFGFYAANFGKYGATYGSLSAVVVLLTWLYLSAYALLFGAELNSELEHQTERDTTTGPERPLGERGAWAADHVAGEEAGSPASGDAAVRQPPTSPARHPTKESVSIRIIGWLLALLAIVRASGPRATKR